MTMTPETRSDLRAAVIGIIVAGVSLYASNWSSDSRALQQSVQQLVNQRIKSQGQINQINYRLDQVEQKAVSNQSRSYNNTETINQLCRKVDISCSTRNAVWRPLGIPNPTPRLTMVGAFAIHDKRSMPDTRASNLN